MKHQALIAVWLLFTLGLLSACGGGGSSSSDTTPDEFSITLEDSLPVATLVESESVTITGINKAAEISISGGEYSINDADYTAGTGVINNNDELRIRVLTPDANDTELSVTVTIGGVSVTVTAMTEVYGGQLLFANDGPELVLYGLEGGELTERGRASIPNVFHGVYSIFSIAKHPTENIVFTTATNNCYWGDEACWGNGQIDAFEYDSNGVAHLITSYKMVSPLKVDSVDDGTTMTITLSNQKSDSFTIGTINTTLDLETTPFSTNCLNTELSGDATCTISYNHAGNKPATNFTINTDQYNYDFQVGEETFFGDDTPTYYAYSPETLNSSAVGGMEGCAAEEGDYKNQYGYCAPTALVISNDGSRAYVNEDNDDIVVALNIAADYSMSFAFEDGDIDLQGIAISADDTVLYGGLEPLAIEEDSLINQDIGNGGNATEVLELNGQTLLVTTTRNRALEIADLSTDLLIPEVLATASSQSESYSSVLSNGQIRFQAHSADLSIFATTGFTQDNVDSSIVNIISFDTAALAGDYEGLPLTVESDLPLDLIDDELCSAEATDCEVEAYARSVGLNDAGTAGAVAAFLLPEEDGESITGYRGAVVAFSVGEDYAIEETDRVTVDGFSRSMLFIATP